MTCQVCGAENGEFHFGAIACKACAAFFRRYVNSRKLETVCICKERSELSPPCRHCRLLKCVASGMIECKVQAKREKTKRLDFRPGSVTTISLLSCNIIPRSCSNIIFTVDNWPEIDRKRKNLYGDCLYDLNLTQISSFAKPDTNLLWSLGEMVFPDVKLLTESDKEAIICNFFPRWLILDAAIDYCSNKDHHLKMIETDGLDNTLLKLYGTSMPKSKRLKDKEIIQIFRPYWLKFYAEVAGPLFLKKCDKVEYMALFLLILFDDAYANISEDGAKLCRNLRKVILRELKGYQTDNNCSEMRLLNVISALLLLERGEENLQEEVLICGLNNVTLHDDFKAIMQVKKL